MRLPPNNGCYLYDDGLQQPMMRHLDGKIYLTPWQRQAMRFGIVIWMLV